MNLNDFSTIRILDRSNFKHYDAEINSIEMAVWGIDYKRLNKNKMTRDEYLAINSLSMKLKSLLEKVEITEECINE